MNFELFKELLLRSYKEDNLPQFIIDYSEHLGDYEEAESTIRSTLEDLISKEDDPLRNIKINSAFLRIKNDKSILYDADPYLDLVDKYEELQNEDPLIIMREINQIYYPHMGNETWDNAYNKFLTDMENGKLLEESFMPGTKITLNEDFDINDEGEKIITAYFNSSTSGEDENYSDVDSDSVKDIFYDALKHFGDKYIESLEFVDGWDYDVLDRDEGIIEIFISEDNRNLNDDELKSKLPSTFSYTDYTQQYGKYHDDNYYEEPYYDENEVEVTIDLENYVVSIKDEE